MEEMTDEKRRIDVVLFDFGGVLAEEGWKNGFKRIAEAAGLDGDTVVAAASDAVYQTGYILGKGAEAEFWKALKAGTGLTGDEAAMRRDIFSRFVLREWMIDLVKKLKAQNLVVGILSDQIDMLDQLDAKYDFFKCFDHVFNSYHIGKGKRDATLFDDIAGLLKTTPERILFIDDHPGYVERARQKGWNAILYTDAESFRMEMAGWLPENPAMTTIK